MSAPETVLYRREGTTGLVTLNRPGVLNALSLAMRRRVGEVVAAADADPEVRAIVVAGAGERAFSVGADITEFQPAASLARVRERPRAYNDLVAGARTPTIAAVHGYCLGGGLELALACDLRIASPDAVFGLPEVRLAIIPGAGGTQRLPRVVGVGQALRMILTGERIDAAEALRIGLVTEIVPRGQLLDRARELAAQVGRGGPLAVAYAKEAVLRGSQLPLADGLRLEADLATLLTNTADRAEGAAAFRERRDPVYKGE